MNLAQAIKYATEKHQNQRRKHIQRPFIEHPITVMRYVIMDRIWGNEEWSAMIAVLHDVVEDCTGEKDSQRAVLYTEIKELFGSVIQEGVRELTNEYTKSRYPTLNREKRKKKEIDRLVLISDRGRTIKLYDRLANLEDTIEGANVAPKFTKMFAKESWDLGFYLSDPTNYYIASQVMTLAAKLRDMVDA